MSDAVEVDGLAVVFGERAVLGDITLSVEAGEWVSVIGPNGSGKTTLLKAIAGLAPADGTVLLNGSDYAVGGDRRAAARQVALMPQLTRTPPALTVAEYVLLGRTPHIAYLGAEREADKMAAAAAIERMSLREFSGRELGSLSGGELQRVVIARALAQAAPILLLDEPTSALDLGHQQEALETIDELRRSDGMTVIAAMHDLTLAGQYSDRVLLLNSGRIVAEGTPQEVLTADSISRCYGAQVRVLNEGGRIYVLPVRS